MNEQLNYSELLALARREGIIADGLPAAEVRRLIADGGPNPNRDPEMKLRAALITWVLERHSQVAAQALCSLDCIACPIGHVTTCFMENYDNLSIGGFVTPEDPWLLDK